MIAIVDYGMGNLRSAQKGFEKAGYEAVLTSEPGVIARADGVVLPGVGAFKDCIDGLRERDLVSPVLDAALGGKPFLGICVGLQLLFDYSEEGEGAEGLGIFSGKVVRFPPAGDTGMKVPHMGWNQLSRSGGPGAPDLLAYTDGSPYCYFVHSYYAVPAEPEITRASCTYSVTFPAIVGRDNILATQFHPEKSQHDGIAILRAFGAMVASAGQLA